MGKNLHNRSEHPLGIIKEHIYRYFKPYNFTTFDNLTPVVSTEHNFDLLRIDKAHPSRSKSDTYYINETTVLRTHTSAHQNQLLAEGQKNFLVTGDVYRKDEIDRNHYNVFHQMEGVKLVDDALEDLKKTLAGLVEYLFPDSNYRFLDDYFPFTHPSLQIEVEFNGSWMEVLGAGVIHREILDRWGINSSGWAFGLGLERLAMKLFNIPDIRLLWSDDPKFVNQFTAGCITQYIPFSPLDPISKDISFWLDEVHIEGENFSWPQANTFYEIVRETFDDNVEKVELIDTFYNNKKLKYSHTYRMTFSPTTANKDPALFNEVANIKMQELTTKLSNQLNLQIR